MFTGLVETVGVIERFDRTAGGSLLLLSSSLPDSELSNGESIAVDGVCLTVTGFSDTGFTVDVSPESLAATTLGDKKAGAKVNSADRGSAPAGKSPAQSRPRTR